MYKRSAMLLLLLLFMAQTACNETGLGRKNSKKAKPGAAFVGPNAVTDQIKISKEIDLVIALDSSGSMREEREAIFSNLSDLILDLQKADIDPQIHLMAPMDGRFEDEEALDLPDDVDTNRVALVDQLIGSHDALLQIEALLSGAYDSLYRTPIGEAMDPPLAFRDEAKLEVLVISDDNAIVGDEEALDLPFDEFDPSHWKATVSGVVGVPNSKEEEGVCQIAAVGDEYISLAEKTGGSILDICSPDWSNVIEHFTNDVLKRSQSILLSQKPLHPESLHVTLNGELLPRESWSYDRRTRLVTLSASLALLVGQELAVNYESAP